MVPMRPVLCLVLALLPLGNAVGDGCVPTTSDPEWEWCDTQGRCHYVDHDACQPECIFSIWLYEESNGIRGLQRADEIVDDTCGGMIESDTIIF